MPDPFHLLLCSIDTALLEQIRPLLGDKVEVREATDPETARRLYREQTPDLVLLDSAAAQFLQEFSGAPDAPPVMVLDEVKRSAVELRLQAEELARQVEERTEALQKSHAQLVEQDKMAALGALVAGIAHDMHTPIGTITSNSDILARSLTRLRELIGGETCPESFRNNPELKRVVGIVEEISRVNQLACDRIIGIVRTLRNFARLDESEQRTANIHEGIDSTLTLVHHELKNRITIQREYGDIPPVRCHPNQLNQVFMNMLVNASHAITGKGTITIRTWRDDNWVKIQIADSGSGIKPEDLARIFDTGFTTKQAGVGTGLGLAICQKIVQEHKGEIEVESELGRGTTFTIRLPVE